MFSLLKYLLSPLFEFYSYIWIDVIIIRETQKAILIMFKGKKNWLPKTWILRMKRNKNNNVIKIKISQYHWAKKC